MSNARKFIGAFNNIESEIKHKYNINKGVGFRKAINDVAIKNRIIAMNLQLLESYAELRNAIVHTEDEDFIIAEPHDDVVEKIKRLEELILNPPKVIPMFQSRVLSLESTDSIFSAINLMFENDYSQIPIEENDKFVGLLNSNTVTRWLGAVDKIIDKNGSMLIMNTDIKSVLQYAENDDNYQFINKDFYIDEVTDLFEKNRDIEALMITHSGNKNEKLLGIITVWDLVEINRALM